MKYLSAYCLVALSGNASPCNKYIIIAAADVKKVLESVGAEVDSNKLNSVIDSLKGKNLNEVKVFK